MRSFTPHFKSHIISLLMISMMISSVSAPLVAQAAITEELHRLEKCGAILTSERILKTDALWVAVNAGTMTGTQACMEIFDHALLQSNGKLGMVNGQIDPIGLKILRNFSIFIRSQLSHYITDPLSAIGPNEMDSVEVLDFDEAVLHHLYSVFMPGEAYSKVVTRNYTFYAERTAVQNRTIAMAGTNFGKDLQAMFAPWTPRFVQTGLLYGFTVDPQTNIPTRAQSVNQHFGAGAIGTQAYLERNLDIDNGNLVLPDGLKQFRPFGKNVFSDFLCRKLPVLRTSDVTAHLSINSTISFNTGLTCLTCHVGMDPMIGVIRHIRQIKTPQYGGLASGVKYMSTIVPSQPSAAHPVLAPDPKYALRPPDGRLTFRSFNGNKIDVPVSSLSALGDEIAKTDDLYACAAKRYYKFLTGIDVDLSDLGDINAPTLSAPDQAQRDIVINLAKQLQTDRNQSIRSMFQKIIAMDAFIGKGL